jgi:hypothetical protein
MTGMPFGLGFRAVAAALGSAAARFLRIFKRDSELGLGQSVTAWEHGTPPQNGLPEGHPDVVLYTPHVALTPYGPEVLPWLGPSSTLEQRGVEFKNGEFV